MLHELDPSHVVISQVMLLHQSEAVYVNNQIIVVEILDLLYLMVALIEQFVKEVEEKVASIGI